MTSVWSQPFGGNPLGPQDALVLFRCYCIYVLYSSTVQAVAHNHSFRLMVIDWQSDFENEIKLCARYALMLR